MKWEYIKQITLEIKNNISEIFFTISHKLIMIDENLNYIRLFLSYADSNDSGQLVIGFSISD